MYTHKSQGLGAVGAVVALMVTFGTAPSNAVADDPPITVESFHDRLEAEAASSSEAATDLRKFEELSPSDQQKLMDYLMDPEVSAAFEHTAQTGESVSVENGDVKTSFDVNTVSTPTNTGASAGSGLSAQSTASIEYNVTASYVVEQRILGVLITKLSQTFKYVTGSGVVLRTSSCTAAALNYNFTVVLSSSVSHYMLAGGMAECDIVWRGYIAYKGSGIQIDKIQSLVVNGPGVVSRSLQNI
ncbi:MULTISPECIES: hypothetical protein [unclassified Microbacterium]|uniref:hypothetical protein n=1 Tax=unclassified Microbacterium TaxID=2609290 RepID=UPI0016051495|nr:MULTISPECIES: hypothetical protein [unclassified Microbacterium]QNA91402.1 hypothetical protein G4G29_01215 [Microbacterium sp. Se63.02b]QYM64568.1 hypothetical protein K1X59_01225 [Microbacterium sp. Se5.02b]